MFDFLQSPVEELDAQLDEVDARLSDIATSAGPGVLSKALHSHLDTGGARVRARATLLAASDSTVDGVAIATAVEALHQASLIHDDLNDRSSMRHGMPSVWAAYGANAAIAAGDLMISGAFSALAFTGNPSSVQYMHTAVARTIRGQCEDVAAKDLSLCDYVRVAQRKSGPLLSLGPVLVLAQTGQERHIPRTERVGRWLAQAYQIADDIRDVAEDAEAGRPNIVDVLIRRQRPNPEGDAAALAHLSLARARRLAKPLPQGARDGLDFIETRTCASLKEIVHAV